MVANTIMKIIWKFSKFARLFRIKLAYGGGVYVPKSDATPPKIYFLTFFFKSAKFYILNSLSATIIPPF